MYSFKSRIDCSSNQRTNTQSDQLLTMISLLQDTNCPKLSKVLRPEESFNTVDGADILLREDDSSNNYQEPRTGWRLLLEAWIRG